MVLNNFVDSYFTSGQSVTNKWAFCKVDACGVFMSLLRICASLIQTYALSFFFSLQCRIYAYQYKNIYINQSAFATPRISNFIFIGWKLDKWTLPENIEIESKPRRGRWLKIHGFQFSQVESFSISQVTSGIFLQQPGVNEAGLLEVLQHLRWMVKIWI